MFGLIKSIGNKAISSLPVFGSKSVKIDVPYDEQLQDKLKEISSQILKAQLNQQFKVYQYLQSAQGADFNRSLRHIYECDQCTTETLNSIIRFYTFLLTNCKNELVICKLVSQPLVIELTKIVLQINQQKRQQMMENDVKNTQQETFNNNGELQTRQEQGKCDLLLVIDVGDVGKGRESDITKLQTETHSHIESNYHQQSSNKRHTKHITPLRYSNFIDWDEVNAYKVALIRAYINCINHQTINYMIVQNQLPIFTNCINGYKHYLTEGVEGTCISNCILMILTKVNHNDEVCGIVFDDSHHVAWVGKENRVEVEGREGLLKSVSVEGSTKLHVFIQQIIVKISQQLSHILVHLQSTFTNNQPQQSPNFLNTLLHQHRNLQSHQQFIQSNILFCVDVINSISNYNYTSKIKQAIGGVIEMELIGKIVEFVQEIEVKQQEKHYNSRVREQQQQAGSKFTLTLLRMIKFILNLSLTCQKQALLIKFLNKHSLTILTNIIQINSLTFPSSYSHHHPSLLHLKQCLTYMCDYFVILIKQTMSPFSKLASRKRLEKDQQILQLKDNILEKIFQILQQITKSEELKQRVCYKIVRNILLTVFYLTIKEDKCVVGSLLSSPLRVKKPNNISHQASSSPSKFVNIGLNLSFNYSILLLHSIFSKYFKKLFSSNSNWQFIVNNYQTLMREVPTSILSPQQLDKYCHYHNNNNYSLEDKIRDIIMVYEAVRNYRYMIIHQTNLQSRFIRLENIYHKHFLSPGWGYTPGEIVSFNSNNEYKIVCNGLLHNNNHMKLPIQILQDFECLLITHKQSENKFTIIANIRYKKISSFVPEGKSLIRMKLIGIQQLILQFGSVKMLQIFKQYLNENRNKTRQKQLKFINYYLNLYLKDTQQMIQQIYEQEIVEDCSGGVGNQERGQTGNLVSENDNDARTKKGIIFSAIETDSLFHLDDDSIPQHRRQQQLLSNHNNLNGKIIQTQQTLNIIMKQEYHKKLNHYELQCEKVINQMQMQQN